jgi:hypothetical protein
MSAISRLGRSRGILANVGYLESTPGSRLAGIGQPRSPASTTSGDEKGRNDAVRYHPVTVPKNCWACNDETSNHD